jgi:tripartite-type tricarboxylate transporter receptor subunit TctC
VQDFMGGHIQMAITGIPQALDMQAKGMARIVAVAGTPAEFRAQLEREAPVVAHAMRAAGVQPE